MLEVNEYFGGQVKSIGFKNSSVPSTVGVMEAGEFTFSTSQKEVMTVVSGELIIKLPDEYEWRIYKAGESFTVDANQSFDVKVELETAYLCTYEQSPK